MKSRMRGSRRMGTILRYAQEQEAANGLRGCELLDER